MPSLCRDLMIAFWGQSTRKSPWLTRPQRVRYFYWNKPPDFPGNRLGRQRPVDQVDKRPDYFGNGHPGILAVRRMEEADVEQAPAGRRPDWDGRYEPNRRTSGSQTYGGGTAPTLNVNLCWRALSDSAGRSGNRGEYLRSPVRLNLQATPAPARVLTSIK